ncbi:RrF2 family transcriptional regulator [Alteribacter aurantiacus]|uniref:RrF2 family transcriptional regulator n=1 Tax=Alteribacter aurantiacus TaxID=254410 RepID=UPI0004011773|nr:Rrf2 family transcriptional regulator [Alteribacter aurantiacus]
MQLTTYTDYSLRLLLYLAVQPKEQLSSVKEVAKTYNISYNHLTKVTYQLGKLEILETVKGRNGGIRLAKDPKDINIGSVVRQTEDNRGFVECFDEESNQCILTPACKLKGVLKEAMSAYMSVLDQYTLSDLTVNDQVLRKLFNLHTN